ncbi:hypothetical protein L208DRAFT_1505184, partial [Tricholoma matsutake]
MFVFSVDANKEVQEDFAANPGNYTKSVNNYLGWLQKEYHIFNEKLGKTGAVCLFFAVTHANNFFLEQLELEFPFWKRLHGFWWMLPNFNPYTTLSEPGQDLAADVLALIWGRGQDNENDEDEVKAFGADDAQGDAINDMG